jgi:hypothetical protein
VAVEFEEMTRAQVYARAAAEGGVRRGEALYAGRPWTQVRDEMADSGAKAVCDLPPARVRALRAAVEVQPAE